MGPSQRIYTELRTRYINGWAPPVTEFPNESFTKPTGVMWGRFNIVDEDQLQMDIGSDTKTYRDYGILRVELFAPMDSGTIDILIKADELAAIFRGWCGATVRCKEAKVNKIGNDGFGWYQVNVSVIFKSDSIL